MNLSHILQSCHTLHNPVEGDALENREHEQRTEEHVFWCTNRESWVTNKGLTSLSSRMFHGLSPLEFHGVMGEGLEPRFASIEPHSYVLLIYLRELLYVVRSSWSAAMGRGSRLAALELCWVKVTLKQI